MMKTLINLFKWGVYYILDWISRAGNIILKLFGYDSNTELDLGLNWLVWLEARRVKRDIQNSQTRRLNKQKEAEYKMRTAKEEVDQYEQDIQNQQ